MSTNHTSLICHMLSSLDGKITSGTSVDVFTDDYLALYDMTDDELQTQGWMCGRVTMEMFAESVNTPLPTTQLFEEGDFVSSAELEKFAVAVDTQGVLRWKENTITSSLGRGLKYRLVILVTEDTPKNYLAYLREKKVTYLIVGQKTLDWEVALSKLYDQLGITKLSLQGGGKINGSLLKAGLVDELSLLMIPLAVNNSNAPSVFENVTTSEDFRTYGFQLSEVRKLDHDVIWLRYKLTTSASGS